MPPRPSSSHAQQGILPQTQPGQPQQMNQVTNQGLPGNIEGQMTSQGVPPPGQHMQGYPPHMTQHGAYNKHGPYPPQSQYSQQYAPRAQFPGYGPGGNPQQQGPTNSPGPQYRPMHGNHVVPQGSQGPQGYPQHAGYPQNIWPPPPPQNSPMQNHIQSKNIGPPHSQSPQPQQQVPNPQQQQQQQSGQQAQGPAGNSPRQLNYLKQHLQHKGGYSQQGSTPPPQQAGYGNGPGMPMGPPMAPSSMGPPPSSHMDNASGMTIQSHDGLPNQDNGMPPSLPHQVTAVVTTGPDGAQLDEASQQSTLSNTSIGMFFFEIFIVN
jgi:AT-rich interactive domain-containing protein 1